MSLRIDAIVSTLLLVRVFDIAPDAVHAYWAQDDAAAGALHWGQNVGRLLDGERQIASSADVILTASPIAAERWSSEGHSAYALPNGCDAGSFDVKMAPDRLECPTDVPHPIAGFVGHLNNRTDLRYLEAILDAGLSLTLVGPIDSRLEGHGLSRLLNHERVAAVGPQPHSSLSRWFNTFDVGIVPYRDDEFNRWSFPLKILEYLAAGLPVVSSDLPAVRWLDCDDISVANDPRGFAIATLAAAQLSFDRANVVRRQEFAEMHSWKQRAQSLIEILGSSKKG